MKAKKRMLILSLIISVIVVLLPIFKEAYYNVNKIMQILNYEKEVEEFELLKDYKVDYNNFKASFLEKTGGIIGILKILDYDVFVPVFSNELEDCALFGDVLYDDCILIKANNKKYFENLFNILNELEIKDEIILNILGKNKKFLIEHIKLTKNFDEKIYCKKFKGCLNFLINIPFCNENNKFLIRARYVGVEETEKEDFLNLVLKNEFLFMISVFVGVILLFLILIAILKVLINVRNRRRVYNEKYLVN